MRLFRTELIPERLLLTDLVVTSRFSHSFLILADLTRLVDRFVILEPL